MTSAQKLKIRPGFLCLTTRDIVFKYCVPLTEVLAYEREWRIDIISDCCVPLVSCNQTRTRHAGACQLKIINMALIISN